MFELFVKFPKYFAMFELFAFRSGLLNEWRMNFLEK